MQRLGESGAGRPGQPGRRAHPHPTPRAEVEHPLREGGLPVAGGRLDEHDPIVNPLGVKGIGELGIIGGPAAIANAVYHATGLRIRDLPITPDKLLRAPLLQSP